MDTSAAGAVAAASAYISLFKLLPVIPASATTGIPLPPPSIPRDFQLPRNYGGGTLIDTLA
jgi:hypothetical protein